MVAPKTSIVLDAPSGTVAEDLVHDCFVALLKRPERFRADRGSQLRTYLFAMVRNLNLKRFGRSQSFPPLA